MLSEKEDWMNFYRFSDFFFQPEAPMRCGLKRRSALEQSSSKHGILLA